MAKMWIVKDVLDHIQGPYSTSEILDQIKNGTLVGEEHVARHPDGTWKQISTEPEFFDHLLSVLTGEEVPKTTVEEGPLEAESQKTVPLDEDTVQLQNSEVEKNELDLDQVEQIGKLSDIDNNDNKEVSLPDYQESWEPFDHSVSHSSSHSHPEPPDDSKSSLVVAEKRNKKKESSPLAPVQHREVKGRLSLFEDRQAHTIEHLDRLKQKEKKQKKAKVWLYLVGALGAGLILGLFFFLEEPQVGGGKGAGKYRLRLPKHTQSQIKVTSSAQGQQVLKKALALIAKDEVSKVVEAQILLGAILKFEPRNPKALLQMCATNYRIWPFTSKSQKDLLVASEYAKRAYGSGVSGEPLSVCRTVEKIFYGKYGEAAQLIDAHLNAEQVQDRVSFYMRYFKGLLLAERKEWNYAASFLESSVKIEGSWIPSLNLLGEVYKHINQSQKSYNVFKRILKLNPIHPEALYQMSILNLEFFGKPKSGFTYFKKANGIDQKNEDTDLKVKSKAYVAVAKYHLKKRNRSQAKFYGEKAFEFDPSNVEAKNILISTGAKTNVKQADRLFMAEAEQLFKEKEWKAAIAIYEQAYRINKKNSVAALRIAECYWKQSFLKEAIRWAELAIAAEPRRVESYLKLAEFLINKYELVQATRVVAKARALNPSSFEIYRMMAQIEYKRKNYQNAVRYAKKALQLYSNDFASILVLAKSLEQIGEVEKAFAHVRVAVEAGQASFELENHYVLLMMKTQGLSTAKNYIEERYNSQSGQAEYKVMYANALLADEQYEGAAKVVQEANVLLEHEFTQGLYTQARALAALKQIDAAIDLYQKAYLMAPSNLDPVFESGIMLLSINRYEGAIIQFQRVYNIIPNYPGLFFNWAKAVKKKAFSEQEAKLFKKSIELSKKELALNPSHFEVYLLIAENYYHLGKLSQVEAQKESTSSELYSEKYSAMISWYKLCSQIYQKALDYALASADIYVDMARCQRLSGHVDAALASVKRAEELDRSNSRIWLEAGLLHEQKGDTRSALKSYETFLLIFPNAPNQDQLQKKITDLKALVEVE